MKRIITFIALSIGLLGFSFVYASTTNGDINGDANSTNGEILLQEEDTLRKAEPGTYEIISLSKREELFTKQSMEELLIRIENNRHETQTVTIQVSDYTAVKIFPKNNIYGKEEKE